MIGFASDSLWQCQDCHVDVQYRAECSNLIRAPCDTAFKWAAGSLACPKCAQLTTAKSPVCGRDVLAPCDEWKSFRTMYHEDSVSNKITMAEVMLRETKPHSQRQWIERWEGNARTALRCFERAATLLTCPSTPFSSADFHPVRSLYSECSSVGTLWRCRAIRTRSPAAMRRCLTCSHTRVACTLSSQEHVIGFLRFVHSRMRSV